MILCGLRFKLHETESKLFKKDQTGAILARVKDKLMEHYVQIINIFDFELFSVNFCLSFVQTIKVEFLQNLGKITIALLHQLVCIAQC